MTSESVNAEKTSHSTSCPIPVTFNLKLSDALFRKLEVKAKCEGVTVESFATELLAEGLVLRAWEIMERRNHMRDGQGGSVSQPLKQTGAPVPHVRNGSARNNFRGGNNLNANDHRVGNGNGGRGGFRRNGGMSQSRYNSIMEDKAEFLEYVRAQERKNLRP